MVRAVAAAAAAVGVFAAAAGAAGADEPRPRAPLVRAELTEPTTRYPHGVLGDEIEYGALVLTYVSGGASHTIRLPEDRVFEDIEPRLVEIEKNGRRAVMIVESHAGQGARLALYDGGGLIAATPWIGTRFRWLSPIGAADLDGDGFVELAYIDRPHLARTLRIWRFGNGELAQVAEKSGLTNHRIGWDHIPGGIRDCGGLHEVITASGDWQRVVATRLEDGALKSRDIGRYDGPDSLNDALGCG